MSIGLLVLDVDGVLTDGTFLLVGERDEYKAFHTADGLGLRLLMDSGVKVALLTGRDSPAVKRRGEELGVHRIVQGRKDKLTGTRELADELGLELSSVAYMGDDLVDIPAMRAVGVAGAPSDARPEACDAAAFVAPSRGGHGAVRDFCEHLLQAAGHWDAVLERFGI
ncbi:MAG: KdsC family phosphatase [Planctomycetota bacterium]|jgi:3-deoxy-D-manno-octulosonate 8-phosphate phosphatase (KDO 8-P phosphatase)